MANREPRPTGSGLRNSARLTRLFHCVSLRRSATMSKTSSGGHAIRVVVVTGTARSYPGARSPLARSAAGDKDVLTAVIVEGFPVESAIESFQVQARDVEEPQPFVLGCPPERAGSTVLQGDVDSVVADAVAVGVRHR